MITKNVREFLLGFSTEELKDRGVLRGTLNQLRAQSVDPLITLMQEQNVERLEYPEHNWYLDVKGNFRNPRSGELKEGKIINLSNPGSVFDLANTTINPFYQSSNQESETPREIEEAEEITFKLERDLQAALRKNIRQLESGLKVIDGGSERTVEAGRIDITAEDRKKKPVVIELKAGIAKTDSITQTLAYMASLEQEMKKTVRGIIVAAGFHPKVILAARAVPNLQLKEYSFTFSFQNR
jgi:hypothetical protein